MQHRRSWVGLAAVVGLLAVGTACGGMSEKKLYKKLYDNTCDQAFKCDEGGAADQWGDKQGCEDLFAEEVELATDYYRACDYSPKDAKDYYKAIKKLDCESSEAEVFAADALWGTVYVCPGGGSTPGVTGTDDTGIPAGF